MAARAQEWGVGARSWYAQARLRMCMRGHAVHVGAVYAGIHWSRSIRMSWLGIILVVIGLFLALKVAGFVMKLAMWALVLFGLYWFLAPRFGLPWPF
jgi:hypothetical protein